MTTKTIALVTGASRGIGRAIAVALAQQNHTVVGTATTEQGAEAITTYFAELGLSGEGIRLNVTDDDDVTAVVKSILKDRGPIQILVNNAGITRDNLLLRMKPDEWASVLNTNLTALYRVSKACLRPMMKLSNGRIINIASVVGSAGNPGCLLYTSPSPRDKRQSRMPSSA